MIIIIGKRKKNIDIDTLISMAEREIEEIDNQIIESNCLLDMEEVLNMHTMFNYLATKQGECLKAVPCITVQPNSSLLLSLYQQALAI